MSPVELPESRSLACVCCTLLVIPGRMESTIRSLPQRRPGGILLVPLHDVYSGFNDALL